MSLWSRTICSEAVWLFIKRIHLFQETAVGKFTPALPTRGDKIFQPLQVNNLKPKNHRLSPVILPSRGANMGPLSIPALEGRK
jgi:hypothetical protein